MKGKLKIALAVILCFILILPVSAVPTASTTEFDEENLGRVQAFIESGEIYDLGLYTISSFKARNATFASLCDDPATKESLEIVLATEEDSFVRKLILEWLCFFDNGTSQYSVNDAPLSYDDFTSVTVSLPGGKTIQGYLYIGNATPPETYSRLYNYPSASQIYASSFYYNCHSFAWYLRGDPTSKPQYWFDEPNGFMTSLPCVQPVTVPRAGDIAVYQRYFMGHPEKFEHSAIIVSVDNGTSHNQIIVKSKWKHYPAYTHILSDCPYYFKPNNNDNSGYSTQITYYRVDHNFVLSGHYYVCEYCGYRIDIPATR